jgi:hypothetical protein
MKGVDVFCERCGTRQPSPPPVANKPGVLARRLLDAVGVTTSDGVPPPFDDYLRLCLTCREYSCPTCWNDEVGVCQTCAPLPEPVVLPMPQPATAFMGTAEPDAALESAFVPVLEPEPEMEPVAAEPLVVAAEPEPEMEPVLAAEPEPEMEPVLAAEPEPELEPVLAAEPEPELGPVVAAEREPEMEPVLAAEPEPIAAEPLVVAAEPEPEMEPVLAADPEPEPIAAEPTPLPEPEPARPALPRMPIIRMPPPKPRTEIELPLAPLIDIPIPPPQIHFEKRPAAYAAVPEYPSYALMPLAPPEAPAPGAVRPCRSCQLSLSAKARFCRRCGTSQAA